MTPLNKDPKMEKNYWLALGLSMLVLMTYPFILKRVTPQRQSPAPAVESSATQIPQSGAAAHGNALQTSQAQEALEQAQILDYENRQYAAQFSTRGASLIQLFYKGEAGKRKITQNLFYSGNPEKPGIFTLLQTDPDETENLAEAIFTVNPKTGQGAETRDHFEFSYERPGEYRIIKRYEMGAKTPTIFLHILVENLSETKKDFSLALGYGMDVDLAHGLLPKDYEAVAYQEKIQSAPWNKISKKGFSLTDGILWTGLVKKYFALLVLPEWKILGQETSGADGKMQTTLGLEPLRLLPGAKSEKKIMIYAGPQRYETLKAIGPELESVLSRGFFGLFKIWLLMALKFFHGFCQNYGWAVIFLTMALKGLFTPLTHMSYASMRKMQALQPKLKSLQERYKKDPTRLNKEMMELYKRNRVNPMGGCLPMLLQIPIFIAFYQVLSETIELKGAPFIFWIHDLAEPDKLFSFPANLPLLGDSFHLLPFLMIGSMFWQQKLTPQASTSPEQAQMMQFMPVIFGFLFYKMPSGLVLYWFVNNLLTILHQIFIKRMGAAVLHHEDRE